jgi:hypothetical protein
MIPSFRDDGPGYIADDPRDREAARHQGADGVIVYQVGNDSNIENAIHDIHRKYRVPEHEEPRLAQLIFLYEQARESLNKAHARWLAQRGKDRWDLEFMLKAESIEVESYWHFTQVYFDALGDLQGFIEGCDTRFPARKPEWEKDPKVISEFS